jgi:hypothetical protein
VSDERELSEKSAEIGAAPIPSTGSPSLPFEGDGDGQGDRLLLVLAKLEKHRTEQVVLRSTNVAADAFRFFMTRDVARAGGVRVA